jgi:hypothetical protein
MKSCVIFHVVHKDTFQWKWRHVRADGRVEESEEQYPLYYDCVSAARAKGYDPQIKCA